MGTRDGASGLPPCVTPPSTIIEPDCIGRRNLSEQQLMPIIAKIKARGELMQEPPPMEGRGILIAGGGKYLKHAWAVASHCRNLGWTEGIQVWHLGEKEITPESRPLFKEIDVELVDALGVRANRPCRNLGGWELKVFGAINCPWRHVLYLDADSHPDVNPAEIFNNKDVKQVGSMFFSDIAKHHMSNWGYVFAGLKPGPKEWESGQWLVDKKRVWMGLRWAFWLGEHSELWYKFFMGDKGTIEAGMRMSGVPYLFSEDARWEGYGIGQYFKGKRWFKHWMASKRREYPFPEEIQALFDDWEQKTGHASLAV